MQIPFYQTEWHGIDLVDLAKDLNHPLHSIPGSQFYAAFYEKLLKKGALSEGWIKKKGLITGWLEDQIRRFDLSTSLMLSIGAGTGIVEKPLIERGFNIDLYDVQNSGFLLSGVNNLANCYTGPLDSMSKKYDLLFSVATSYALTDVQLETFFFSCSKILNKNGKFFLLDTSLSFYEIYSWFRNKKYLMENCLYWGNKRSINKIEKLSKKQFFLKEYHFHDNELNELQAKRIFNVPYNVTPVWQALIFEKI